MDLNGGLTYEGYGAVEDFPVVVFGVDIADMVDIGTLLAGLPLVGTVPTASETIKASHSAAVAVVYGNFGFENVVAACNGEDIVGFKIGSNDVGGLNPNTVNRGITPRGNNNECIEDNAVAGVRD